MEDEPCTSQEAHFHLVEEYTVRQHSALTFAYFKSAHELGNFNDIRIFHAGHHIVSANRLVLAAFSTIFETTLISLPHSSITQIDIDPRVIDVDAADLLAIVQFMYDGFCNEPGKSLLRSASLLGCKSLCALLTSNNSKTKTDEHHSVFFQQRLLRFRDDGLFLDCNITALGSNYIRAHRLLLCAHSRHFESALLQTKNSVQVTLNIDSNEIAVSGLDKKCLVEFVYSGKLMCHKKRYQMLRAASFVLGLRKLAVLLDKELGETQLIETDATNDSTCEPSGMDYTDVTHGDSSAGEDEEYHDHGVEGFDNADELATQATEDYVSIYEEYVMGPRRGKRSGTYGITKPPLFVKGQTTINMTEKNDDGVNEIKEVPAVVMSFLLVNNRKRRLEESFGYGLPEYIGSNDVAVPLVVGNQKEMMEKPFKCPHCDHRTKERSGIDKHIRCMHTGEAPFKCKYCNQAFKVQSNLVRHIRAHTGEKPYACKKCGNSYADKKNMDAHVYREHLNMQQLVCQETLCGKKFWRHDRFAHHCLKFHGSLPTFEQGNIYLEKHS